MREKYIKRLYVFSVVCGIACYAFGGVWVAMIIEDSPSNVSHLAVMAIASWLIGTAIIASASYFRNRVVRLSQEKKPRSESHGTA
jgi:hypothetical protein